MVGVFNSIGASVPPNAGSFRRIEVLLRENCVVGIPRHPASCSAATTNLADRVAERRAARAVAELADGIGLAECGGVIPAAAGVVSGSDPRNGDEPFVNQIFLGHHRRRRHAVDRRLAHDLPRRQRRHAAGATASRSTSCGTRCSCDAQRLDARHRGRRAATAAPRRAYVEYGPAGTSMKVAYGSDGVENPALGRARRAPRRPVEALQARARRRLTDLPPHALVELAEGERIVSVTAGGGGYGPPAERDPERVRHDVAEGWVTPQRARDVYRVALTRGLLVDEDGDHAIACLTRLCAWGTFAVSALRTSARIVQRGARMATNTGFSRYLLAAIVCAGLALGLAACGGDDSKSDSSSSSSSKVSGGKSLACKDGALTVGIAKAKSGGASFFDVAGTRGAKIAFDQINAKGGIKGCQIKVDRGRHEERPGRGAQVARSLIDKGAQILLVPDDFDLGIAAARVGQKAGVLTLSTAASSTEFAKAVGDKFFNGGPDDGAARRRRRRSSRSTRAGRRTFLVVDPGLAYFTEQDTAYTRDVRGGRR